MRAARIHGEKFALHRRRPTEHQHLCHPCDPWLKKSSGAGGGEELSIFAGEEALHQGAAMPVDFEREMCRRQFSQDVVTLAGAVGMGGGGLERRRRNSEKTRDVGAAGG